MRIVKYYPETRQSALGLNARGPWAGLESEIDQLFNNTVAHFLGAGSGRQFPVDLYEDKNNAYVRAELPGVKREDIKVETVDGYLTIAATRAQQANGREDTFAVSRSVSLPDGVQADKVSAAYENGVLTVTLPKQEEAKPRKVSVEVK